jgi:SH3-like domain-containing protein
MVKHMLETTPENEASMTRIMVLILLAAFCMAAQAAPPQKSAPEQKPAPGQNPALGQKPAAAQEQAAPFQSHFVSQRPDKAYMREGPSYDHKVVWVYQHKGYPLLVTASFDVWRRVMDLDGTVGWMSAQMLSDKRTVLVTGDERLFVHASDDPDSKIVGAAEPGAILNLKSCERDFCHVNADRVDGWIDKARVWGVNSGEVFK